MEYIIPRFVEEIHAKIGTQEAYYLAGGTDIMALKKENKLNEELPIVDLSGLEELKGISRQEDFIIIGALTTMSEIATNKIIMENAKALRDAADEMGSPLIRNIATIGGNISNTSPAGDMIPPVYAHDAVLMLQMGNQKREVPVNEFCMGPCDNILNAGEIITHIKIPLIEGSISQFLKIGARNALAISKVSMAVRRIMDHKTIKEIFIAMGAVGPKCIRAKKTENILRGQVLSADIIKDAAASVYYESCPIDDFRSTEDYRRKMCSVLLARILKEK